MLGVFILKQFSHEKHSVFQRSRKEVEKAWSGDWDKWQWEYWAQFLQFKGK